MESRALHDRRFRELLAQFHGAEAERASGFLVIFERPAEAVAFALEYQRSLPAWLPELRPVPAARAAVHLAEVLSLDNPAEAVSRGARAEEIESPARPRVARLLGARAAGADLVDASGLRPRAQGRGRHLA